MTTKRGRSPWRGAVLLMGIAVLATLTFSLLLPARASVAVTVPYSTTPVADNDLDGDPATGAWGDANSYTVPLENGAASPYGTATLYVKHDGTYVYYRIDGSIDVSWTSATGNHFWLGMQLTASGTSHHGGAAWDGIFFGESSYSPQPTYPPAAVDINGFGKPPTKDASQDATGAMKYSGSAAPFSFTAEWKKKLDTGDADDIALAADGATTYNFFVTTDSNGKGSQGGSIDHKQATNLNTLKVESVPTTVHDVAVADVTPSPTSVAVGETVTVTVTVENQGTESETFDVVAYYDSTQIGTQNVNLAAGGSTQIIFSWNTTGISLGTYTISATASQVTGETDTTDNTFTDGIVNVKSLQAPSADFTFTPQLPYEGQTITFNASSSTPDGGTIVSYQWDFDDGTNGTGQVVTHNYTTAGGYTVTLNVTDSDGFYDVVAKTVTVYRHDVAVVSVTPSPTDVLRGELVMINVTVSNEGDFNESFDVTAYFNSDLIDGLSVTDLAPAANETLSFIWNTTGVSLGNHTIKAEADTVPGESDTADNTFIDGQVKVSSSIITCNVSSASISLEETITVSGSIRPPISALVTINYTRPNGTSITRMVSSNSSGLFSDSYTPDMKGTWTVKASWPGDLDHPGGAVSSSVSFTVIFVDTSSPIITVNGPADELNTTSTTVSFNVSATDLESGIEKVELYIDGQFKTVMSHIGAGIYTAEATGLEVGNHTWHAKAYNGAGLSSESGQRTFTIQGGVANGVEVREPDLNTAFIVTVAMVAFIFLAGAAIVWKLPKPGPH